MKKYLLLIPIAILLLFGNSLSQTVNGIVQGNFNLTKHYYTNLIEYRVTFTDVDSLDLVNGLTTDVFDWSDIASSTSSAPNFRYAYTTTSANDTLMCLLDGYDPLTGNYNTLDSLGGIVIYSTTNGGTTTYGTVSLSTNGYSPYIRLKIKRPGANNDQADNGTFEISLFAVPVITTDDRWRK